MKETKLIRKKQFRWIILIVSILMLSIALNFNMVRAVQVKNPNALVLAKSSEPWSLDSVFASGAIDFELVQNCYDTLVAYDREKVDTFVPRLATEVPSIENEGISPDFKTYRFHIRSGVTFANGAPLTPEDIEYTFERAIVRDPGWPTFFLVEPLLGVDSTRDGSGGFTVTFEDIDNAIVVEGNDVVFHLAKPFAPFMQILASWFSCIISKQWCIANGDWPGTAETWEAYNNFFDSPLHDTTMGTGPFKLESWTPDEVVLARNDLYFRGPARLEKVVHKIIGYDPDTSVQMLIDGDVDSCSVPRYKYAELEGVEGIRVFKDLPSLVVYFLEFNYAIPYSSPHIGSGSLDGYGIPPDFFNDIDVRRAFAYAFDYDSVINNFWDGEALQPASVIIEGLPFHNPDQATYTFDLDMARAHLMQAWGGEVWEKGFTFSLTYLAGSATWYAIAEMLKVNIESLHSEGKFHIELVGLSWWEIWAMEWPTFIWGWGADFADPDNFVYPLLHSSQAINGYSDAYVDYLIEAGVSTVDPAEREAIYYQLQSVYHDEAISLPIAQPLSRHYERDWVQGWYYNPFFTDYYSIYKHLYIFGGILQPINPDGSSLFKSGQRIPVKFQLFDIADPTVIVSDAQATLEVTKISDGIVGNFMEVVPDLDAYTGNLFRYDEEDQQYIFILSTRDLEKGTYELKITLDDGQIFTIEISLI